MSSTTIVYETNLKKTNEVLAYADECRQNRSNTDVCVKAGEKSFYAHRLILSCYSLYFRGMFQSEMKEKFADAVEIEGVDETSLESLIEFIYSGKVSINKENVYHLLAASDYLQIEQAKQFCFNFLSRTLSVSTCFEISNMADTYRDNDLSNKTFQFIVDNFHQVSINENFMSQSKQNIHDLISKMNLICIDKRLIHDAIIGWVNHNESRKKDFAELFQLLDLSKLSSPFLAETILTETLVTENQFCYDEVEKILQTRKYYGPISNNALTILSCGGVETRTEAIVVYNDDQKVYPALLPGRTDHCSLKLDGFVYCIGGESNYSSTCLTQKMSINEANIKWEKVDSMQVARSRFGAAVYKNGFAVAGGWSHVAEKSAEFYNPSHNQWSPLPKLNECRWNNALVSCDDKLFCLGGYDSNKRLLSSVEMLCDLTGSWKPFKSMQTPKIAFAAVNCKNTIYAIGGCHDDQQVVTKAVEKYDYRLNRWVFVKEMKVERYGHAACVMQNKIFVIGGKNASDEFVSEIECYDPEIDDWSIIENTNKNLIYHAIVAI